MAWCAGLTQRPNCIPKMKKRFIFNTCFVYVVVVLCFLLWLFLFLKNDLNSARITVAKINEIRRKNGLMKQLMGDSKGRENSFRMTATGFSLPSRAQWHWAPGKDDYMNQFIQGKQYCNGSFIGYHEKFAKLLDVVVNPKMGLGRKGGENMSEVMNQPESSEYYTFKRGYFSMRCVSNLEYNFHTKTHVKNWFDVLEIQNDGSLSTTQETIEEWTIAVQRYEYVNLYHTMTDFFNTFLVAKAFQMEPGNINILWIDGHPSGSLDKTWVVLFGKVLRSGSIRNLMHFRRMIWGIMGYDSPLNKHDTKFVPYLEEFRNYFLTRHDIPSTNESAGVNCKNIKVLFIWRRDYVAHPRNPLGSVSRKIKNEDELLATTRDILPGHDVSGIQIDKLTMKDQLKLIAKTDILIGMHGAGLTHTLFLPKHAGLIEFYPTYWSSSNLHFRAMARWRNLHYLKWENSDGNRELPNHYTIIDIDSFKRMLTEMKHKLCG